MHCLQVTYRVTGLPDDRLRESFAAAIPALQAVPGLRAKLWLAEPNGRSAGGVYVFDGEREADDYLARVFQHETDHLDGVFFLDRLPPEVTEDHRKALAAMQRQAKAYLNSLAEAGKERAK